MGVSKADYNLLKRVLLLYKPYIKKILIVFICIIASTVIHMIMPFISKLVMDNGLIPKDFKMVLYLSVASILLMLLDQGIGIFETRYWAYLNAMLSFSMNKAAIKQLLKSRIEFFNNTNFAEIMTNINMDIRNISRVSEISTFFVVTQIFTIIGGIAGLVLIDWKLSFVVICILPMRYGVVRYLTIKRRRCFEQYMEYYKDYSSWFGDIIGGIKEVKLWGIDTVIMGQFIQKQRKIIKAEIYMNMVDKFNDFSDSILWDLLTNALYIIGAYLIINSNLTIGGLFAFITYSSYVTHPLSAILSIGYGFSSVIPAAKRYFEFIDMDCEKDIGIKSALAIWNSKTHGIIKFENVSFSYEGDKKILDNVNFEIKAGEKTAIIGSNGSGKSTIISLLQRLYAPSSGRILLDGEDISKLRLKEYRKQITFINHDSYLFNTSVKENIKLFTRKQDMKVYKAAQASGAHEFIKSLQEDYNSRIGRNGTKLSGGQRQKVALARAFFRDSDILVLDEATCNFDTDSEAQLYETLERDFKEKTVIVITHKPHVLKNMDRVLLVDEGSVKELEDINDIFAEDGAYNDILTAGAATETVKDAI